MSKNFICDGCQQHSCKSCTKKFENQALGARKALAYYFLGRHIKAKTDRPVGTEHPKHPGLLYPINYGYIEGVFSPDGEELDVYFLGESKPVEEFYGRVIAIVHRRNDIEDKLCVAPDGTNFTKEEIAKAIEFQEHYYDSFVETFSEEKE